MFSNKKPSIINQNEFLGSSGFSTAPTEGFGGLARLSASVALGAAAIKDRANLVVLSRLGQYAEAGNVLTNHEKVVLLGLGTVAVTAAMAQGLVYPETVLTTVTSPTNPDSPRAPLLMAEEHHAHDAMQQSVAAEASIEAPAEVPVAHVE